MQVSRFQFVESLFEKAVCEKKGVALDICGFYLPLIPWTMMPARILLCAIRPEASSLRWKGKNLANLLVQPVSVRLFDEAGALCGD